MIPSEVAAIADLICPDWTDLDEEACHEVIDAQTEDAPGYTQYTGYRP